MNLLFKGSGVALITPFDEQNQVSYPKLEELIEAQIANHTDALIICGTTGETPTLSLEEYEKMIPFTVNIVKGRIPLIAGAGSNSTKNAVALSQFCQKSGVDGLLHATPYYNKPSQEGIIAHFTTIAKETTLPIILYNIPSRTGVSIQLSSYEILQKIPNIVGTKEASGDISLVGKLKRNFPNFPLYTGNDDQILPTLSLGGEGVISVIANLYPKEIHTLCHSFFTGDIQQSQHLQLQLLDLINHLFYQPNPAPIKTLMNLLGKDVGGTRLPLIPLSKEEKKALSDCYQSLPCSLTHW